MSLRFGPGRQALQTPIFFLHSGSWVCILLRELPRSQNQFPNLLVAKIPARHAGESYSIFNDIEHLAIRKLLYMLRPKVGDPRGEALCGVRLTGAIVAVASCAVLGEDLGSR